LPTIEEHECAGFAEFRDAADGCRPSINRDGRIDACDGTNPVPITHCPWCGIELSRYEGDDDIWDED
jgi:hypothetical protein